MAKSELTKALVLIYHILYMLPSVFSYIKANNPMKTTANYNFLFVSSKQFEYILKIYF